MTELIRAVVLTRDRSGVGRPSGLVVIDIATGGGVVSAIGLAVIVGIVASAISFAISRTISASLRKRS